MFEGFTRRRLDADGVAINAVTGGSGPPLLLLHGYPQTHVTWHKVAPMLAGQFSVVVPDLRGYGDSDKPPGGTGGAAYAKRVMAADMVTAMAALGHERFHLAGHDRGGRVAYRLALDHLDRVIRLATLDIIPTLEQFERMGKGGSFGSFHWYFLAQAAPFPETLIGTDPAYFLRHMLESWCATDGAITDALSARHATIIAPVSASIATSTGRTERRASASNARCWLCGARAAGRTRPMAFWRSGGTGPSMCAARRSIVDISCPKKRQTRPLGRLRRSLANEPAYLDPPSKSRNCRNLNLCAPWNDGHIQTSETSPLSRG